MNISCNNLASQFKVTADSYSVLRNPRTLEGCILPITPVNRHIRIEKQVAGIFGIAQILKLVFIRQIPFAIYKFCPLFNIRNLDFEIIHGIV